MKKYSVSYNNMQLFYFSVFTDKQNQPNNWYYVLFGHFVRHKSSPCNTHNASSSLLKSFVFAAVNSTTFLVFINSVIIFIWKALIYALKLLWANFVLKHKLMSLMLQLHLVAAFFSWNAFKFRKEIADYVALTVAGQLQII